MLDVLCAQQLTRDVRTKNGVIPNTVTLAINRSPEELYRYWRDFSNLPALMEHLISVDVTGEQHSHWVATGPAGSTVQWDAEIADDRPNEAIAWRSVEGSDVTIPAPSVSSRRRAGAARWSRSRCSTVHPEARSGPL